MLWFDEPMQGNVSQQSACRALLGVRKLPFCVRDVRLPHTAWVKNNPEKFFQINLTPLGRFGTLEFRLGSASADGERVARWIQLIVGMVDASKDPATVSEFFDEDIGRDLMQLQEAQDAATPEALQQVLKGHVQDDFFEYFAVERPFEDKVQHPDTSCVKLP